MKYTRLPTQHELFERKLAQARDISVTAERPLIDAVRAQIDELVARSPSAIRKRRAKPTVVTTKVVRYYSHGIRNDDAK